MNRKRSRAGRAFARLSARISTLTTSPLPTSSHPLPHSFQDGTDPLFGGHRAALADAGVMITNCGGQVP